MEDDLAEDSEDKRRIEKAERAADRKGGAGGGEKDGQAQTRARCRYEEDSGATERADRTARPGQQTPA